MPERIQRKRTKGWRMPEGAVYVGRPTKWGNPWRVVREGRHWVIRRDTTDGVSYLGAFSTQEDANAWAADGYRQIRPGGRVIRAELAGRDLACWCPLDHPCHADVLLEIANRRTLTGDDL